MVAEQPPPCKSDNGVTLPPAGAVAVVVAEEGSPATGSRYRETTVRDVTMAEATAARGRRQTRLTIALSQTAETVDVVVPEKRSSSNYPSCRWETPWRLPSAEEEEGGVAVPDSRAEATVPAGSMEMFFSCRFTTNRTRPRERFSGCSG